MRISKIFLKRLGVGIFEKWADFDATLNLISTCKIFIGEKLHSLVFSAATNTPFIGLAYAPAHFDFVESIGFSKFTIPTTKITAEKILDLFDELLNNYEKIQNRLSISVNEYRKKQIRFADKISSDLESLPENKWSLQNNNANNLMIGVDFLIQAKFRRTWEIWNKLVFTPLAPYLFFR